MNKQEIISHQKSLRKSKDILKQSFLEQNENAYSKVKIVIPASVYIPRGYTNADQWFFNGFIIENDGNLTVVDPGVDFYSRFTTTGYEFSQISTLIITHNHIDHSASAAIFIEKMMKFKNKDHRIYISQDAWETKIPSYLKEKSLQPEYQGLVVLLHGKSGAIVLGTNPKVPLEFVSLYHSCPDTFGFIVDLGGKRVGYISDTGYSISVETDRGIEHPEATTGNYQKIIEKHTYIADFYRTCEIIVVNINDLDFNRHSKYHLSGWDVLDILEGSYVKKMVLQHLSSTDAEGEDSNYLYKLFFGDQTYQTLLPHFMGRSINI